MRAAPLIFAGALLAFSALGTRQAEAVTCSVNIEQAYQVSIQSGWRSWCHISSALTFNSAKRIGCTLKRNFIEGRSTYGAFFCNQSRDGELFNGWSLDSYKMSGGQFTRASPLFCLIRFSFYAKPGAGYERRHLRRLKLKKDGGDCANVLNEAFSP